MWMRNLRSCFPVCHHFNPAAMTSSIPDIRPTASYPIGEAAEILGISARHLLRLATAGVVKYTISRRNGRKSFSGKELIRYLRG